MKATQREQDSSSSASERIAFLDSLRAIAIIMVVADHTLGYCLELPHDHKQIVSFIVHTASVPVFFLVDGYLFARAVIDLKNYSYPKYVRSSLFRLLAPWIVFTLGYTLARYVFELNGFLSERMILGQSWQKVLISAYGSVYAPQMYFLFSLLLIRLCSPIFRKLLFNKKYFVLLFLVFCYYTAYKSIVPYVVPYLQIEGGQEPVLHAFWGMQFYLAGIVLFITAKIVDLRKLFMPILSFLIVALLIRSIFAIDGWSNSLVQHLYLLTIFVLFTFLQSEVSLLKFIGRNTMGIYLIHAPILLKGFSLILTKYVFHPMMLFVLVLFTTCALSIYIVMFINSVPYGCLLFGTPYHRKD